MTKPDSHHIRGGPRGVLGSRESGWSSYDEYSKSINHVCDGNRGDLDCQFECTEKIDDSYFVKQVAVRFFYFYQL